MKTKTTSRILSLVSIVLFSGCMKDATDQTIGSFPEITATTPSNNSTDVTLNQQINVTFNKEMDASTFTATTFNLTGSEAVSGTISYTGNTASFDPTTNLSPMTTYTVLVSGLVKDLSGTPLTSTRVWTFTTGATIAPSVSATSPVNFAIDVALNKVLTATFSEAMDANTISVTNFTLTDGTNPIAGVVSYEGTTASFKPSESLVAFKTYTATIKNGAKNTEGYPLARDYSWTFNTNKQSAGKVVNLGTAIRFGIIAGVGISNNGGFSEIRNLDIGISPGVRSSITGFPPAILTNGAIYASDDIAPPGISAMLIQAKQDLTDAYLFAEGATSPAPATVAGDQGGKTLAPGIYKSTSTLLIQSGDLTLDAQGNPDAVWIFQIASDFTTIGGAGGNVILSGGAQAKNVYWQTGSSATIGDYTMFKGNILALTSITLNSHATAEGRMLARNGSVVMTMTNIISSPQ